MLDLRNQEFPRLDINNITLNKNSIDVSAFVTSKRQILHQLSSAGGILATYAQIYFIVSVPKSPNDPRILRADILNNPKKRFGNIAGYFKKTSTNSFGWYEHVKKMYYTNKIPLMNVISNFRNFSQSRLANTDATDANFEISIPIEEELYNRTNVDEIMLHSFVQLDIKKMIEDGVINRISNNIKGFMIGGNLKSKKILERSALGMTVPTTKQGLATENGIPYNGKYVSRNGEYYQHGANGQKLKIVQSPETSISANYFIEKHATIDINRPREETKKELEHSFTKPILEFSKSDIPVESDTTNIYNKDYVHNIKTAQHIRKVADPHSTYISNAVHSVNSTPNFGYNIRFDINWEKIIKHKTKYGFLIDLVNKNRTINNLIRIGGIADRTFNLENILRNFSIRELIIERVKADGLLGGSNNLGSKRKIPLQEGNVKIVSIQNFSFASEYATTTYSLETIQNTQAIKTLQLRDTKLYTDQQQGQYFYTIKMIIEDKVEEYFSSLLSNFRNNLKALDDMLFLLSVDPFQKQSLKTKDKQQLNNQSLLSSGTAADIALLIDTYLLLLLWNGKEFTREGLIKTRTSLFTMADASYGGTVSGLHKFKDLCESMAYQTERMVENISTNTLETEINKQNFFKKLSLLQYEFKVPGMTTTMANDQILISHSMETNNSLSATPTVMPKSFYYKDNEGAKEIISRTKIKSTQSMQLKEDRLLVLDNALKKSEHPHTAAYKISKNKIDLEMENIFNLSGVSVAIPTKSGTFGTSNKMDKNTTTSAESDAASSLSSNMKSSLASSVIKKPESKTLTKQQQKDIDTIKQDRVTIARSVIKLLSSIYDTEPKHINGSIPPPDVSALKDLEEQVFSSRSGLITVGVPSTSGEMEFQPLTEEVLSTISGETVLVKIQEPSTKNKKEDYKLIDNVFNSTKSNLKNLLVENR